MTFGGNGTCTFYTLESYTNCKLYQSAVYEMQDYNQVMFTFEIFFWSKKPNEEF